MIDIHTHLLPFVDDGVEDFDESIEIIKSLFSQGINHIFITPHYYRTRNYLSSVSENQSIFSELKKKVEDLSLDISLYLGNEIFYDKDTLKNIEKGVVLPLINNYYLIEFSIKETLYDMTEAVHNMVAKGYKPIIAHIERYSNLKKIEDVKVLKKIGALVQVNAYTILGQGSFSNKRLIRKLLKNDFIDFIATDSHQYHENHFIKAYKHIEKKYSQDQAEKLFNNQTIFKK
ncbi:MAG: CpsB/CapC family capsule biosynthesis tyrosine phosphatase [Candidatus Izemoplasmatales bacterium]